MTSQPSRAVAARSSASLQWGGGWEGAKGRLKLEHSEKKYCCRVVRRNKSELWSIELNTRMMGLT